MTNEELKSIFAESEKQMSEKIYSRKSVLSNAFLIIFNDLSFRIVADERASVDGGSFCISCFNSSAVHSIFIVSSNTKAPTLVSA